MAADPLATAQVIVDGPWRHAAAARTACRAGAASWSAFVDTAAPPAPRLLGRVDFARCCRQAAAEFAGPHDRPVRLVPLWAGSAEEEPAADWFVAHAIQMDEGAFSVVESGPQYHDAATALPRMATCRARVWRVAHVVESRSYSPEIPLLARRGAYGVLASEVIELMSVEETEGEPLARPTAVVPAFGSWFEPRTGGLSSHPTLKRNGGSEAHVPNEMDRLTLVEAQKA